MQYALMKASGSRYFVIDANELSLIELEHAGGAVPERFDDPEDPTSQDLLVYGAYMPNPGISDETALQTAQMPVGHTLSVYLPATNEVRSFVMTDIVLGPPVQIGASRHLPFAALIRIAADDDLPWLAGTCLTGFVKYAGLTPATSLVNRQGLYAFATPDWRDRGDKSLREFADMNRATRIAGRIA